MNPYLLLGFVIAYFIVLLVVAWYTSRNSNNESFFIGNRNSNWMLVAFGMIGTSLSGVTFVSVPGAVGNGSQFNYFQVVIGYFIGYLVIAYVLLPLYYRLNLTSIYKYLDTRFGMNAHKTGAGFFILSRTLGATARLYLVVNILQIFILDAMNIPFWVTTSIILLMILLYTFEGGVKTIVYTDTLQTTGMLVGLIVAVIAIMSSLGLNLPETFTKMRSASLSGLFNTDVNHPAYFLKQILGGAVITIAMTGLDQEMMQKNISVNKLGNSQKNMMTFTTILVVVNLLFLILGGLLYLYAAGNNIATKGDDLFPTIALSGGFSTAFSIIFIIALISALFPSVDGAITALTSSFCIDLLGLKEENPDRKKTAARSIWLLIIGLLLSVLLLNLNRDKIFNFGDFKNSITYGGWVLLITLGVVYWYRRSRKPTSDEQFKKQTRLFVHFSFAIIFYALVILFKWINEKSIIDFILKIAGFTYGPLLGLFFFGILTKKMPADKLVPAICLGALLLTLSLDLINNPQWYQDKFGLKGNFIENTKVRSTKIFGGKIVPGDPVLNGVTTGKKLKDSIVEKRVALVHHYLDSTFKKENIATESLPGIDSAFAMHYRAQDELFKGIRADSNQAMAAISGLRTKMKEINTEHDTRLQKDLTEAQYKLWKNRLEPKLRTRLVLDGGYKIGLELLFINGLFTFLGLWLISRKNKAVQPVAVPAK